MRELMSAGLGVGFKSADPMTKEDECLLWEKEYLLSTATKQHCIFLQWEDVWFERRWREQFQLGYDTVNNQRYVKFLPRNHKNAQGGLKTSKKAQNIIHPIVRFDQENESDVSINKLYETYLNLIPRTGNFYKKPLNGTRFSAGNISQKDLKGMMKNLFQQAGISQDNRVISSHSGWVTLCTTL